MARREGVTFVDQTGQLGGAELWLLDLVSRRQSDDHVVLLQDGPFLSRLASHGVSAEVLSAEGPASSVRKGDGLLKQLSALSQVRRLALRLADIAVGGVLYANTPKALVVSALACRRSSASLIYHLHDILSPDHFSVVNRRLLVFLANRYASKVIANSTQTAAAYSAAGGKSELLSVVHNGIDSATHEQALKTRDVVSGELRHQLGLGEEPVVALFARIASWKGQHLAVEAIGRLQGVHLLLVGDDLFDEDQYSERVQAMAQAPGVAGRVHLLGFRDNVPELMQVADIVLHCSTAPEPFGRVIVEGMLAERPVIASNAGGAAEIVKHGETGLLTELGSVEDLARAIKRLLDNPKESRRMAKAGRVDALKRFNINDRVADINGIIDEVAQEGRGRSRR